MPSTTCAFGPCGALLQGPLLRCSLCKKKAYCNKTCQRSAWKSGHKVECATMVANGLLTPAPLLTNAECLLLVKLFGLYKMEDWLGALTMQEAGLALAQRLRDKDPKTTAEILQVFGFCYQRTGDCTRACELLEESMALCEALGDSKEIAYACGRLAISCEDTGYYRKAHELHEKSRDLFQALGDNSGVATACGNMGNCHMELGNYGRAYKLYEESMEMWAALGNRAGMAAAYNGLGNFYDIMGDHKRAQELHEMHKSICETLGDCVGVSIAFGNIGNCYLGTGDYASAREMHERVQAMRDESGNRVGLEATYYNLGICCLKMGDYVPAISYFTEQYNRGKEMQHKSHQSDAALGMGVAHRLRVRANLRGRAAGPSELAALHASESVRSDDIVWEAEKWLQTALDLGDGVAQLHLAHLANDAGDEHTALEHLQGYLAWYVEEGPIKCHGCGQKRGADAPMLTCGGCRVARFCNAKHQKMASKNLLKGGNWLYGKHKDVCGLVGKWRQQVVKGGFSSEVLHEDLLAFLRE